MRSPDSLDGYQNLFLNYLQTKQPQEALKVLDEAAARPKPDAEFLIGVAELYASLGLGVPSQKEAAKAKALALLKRARPAQPDQSAAATETGGRLQPAGRLRAGRRSSTWSC